MSSKVSWVYNNGDTLNKTFETRYAARAFISRCNMLGNRAVTRVQVVTEEAFNPDKVEVLKGTDMPAIPDNMTKEALKC
jgi:hypothetical protein